MGLFSWGMRDENFCPALSLRRHRWLGDLLDLGATAVELLPVHESVREAFLLQRGLTSYWGDNTIGYFTPHQRYSATVRDGGRGGPGRRPWCAGPAGAPVPPDPHHLAAVLRDPLRGRESALSTVGVMPAGAGGACLVPAPAELSMVGTAWKVLVRGDLGGPGTAVKPC
jgi:hypothetical protein